MKSFAPDLKPNFDYPRASKSLRDFTENVTEAIANGDESLLQHLSYCFRVSDDGAFYIGCICGHGRDASSNDKRTRT